MAILFKDMDRPKSCISDDEVCPILKADLCKAFPLVTASVIHQYFPQYFEQDVVNKGRLKDCPLVEVDICTEQQWILCSERLPEKDGRYWISTKTIACEDNFENGEFVFYRSNVLAWMPLPEPYKAESEE